MSELLFLLFLSIVAFSYDMYQLRLIKSNVRKTSFDIKYEIYWGLLKVLYSAGLPISHIMNILEQIDFETASKIFRFFQSKLLEGQNRRILSIFTDINMPHKTALESMKTTLNTIERVILSRLYQIEEFEEESTILIFMLLFIPLISIEIVIILGNILILALIPVLHIIATLIIKRRLKEIYESRE